MSGDLIRPGVHRAGRVRAPVDAAENAPNSGIRLVAAAVLGICAVFAVLVINEDASGRGAPPPQAAPNADEWNLPDAPLVEPPRIEFTMSAWPTANVSPTPAPTSVSSPPPRVSPRPSTATVAAPPRPTPTSATGSPAPPPVTFTAVAGYSCPGSATHGFSENGRYTNGQIGWYSVGSGAWTGNGCAGRFDAMEMSGYAQADDPTANALWWFAVGSASKRCDVSVYVPSSSNSRDVAGKPAQYFVMDSETAPVRAGFTVDQRYTRGQWVTGGSHDVHGARLVIKLVNRGEDWTLDGPTYEHIAVAQVRLTCTG